MAAMIASNVQEETFPLLLWINLKITFPKWEFFVIFWVLRRFAQNLGKILTYCFYLIYFLPLKQITEIITFLPESALFKSP